ncbi:MAG TPA: PEP-CTERM sorting domain-containing protein [Phycisphaerae bacterium]|nr:PEP-CTERM sorting domain-containing protein [Phycisphaerae bacterium]
MPRHHCAPAGQSVKRTQLALAGAIAAALAAPLSSHAATDTWLDTDGFFWNNTAGWVSGVLPVNGDIVNVGTHSSAASSPTLNFTSNLTSSGITLNTLDINSTQVGTMIFSQTLSTSAMSATSEIIGDTISGNVYSQNAGSNTASGITLANNSGSSGNYNFSGGTITATIFTVGNSGTGVANQTAGTANITSVLVVGALNTSSGTYTLSGTGTLNAANEILAENNTGSGVVDYFNQTGGTNNIISNGSLTIGQNGNGTYTLSNGTLNQSGTGAEIIGYGGNGIGTLTQSGGVNNATNIQIGSALSTTGFATYNLQGGNLSVSNGNVMIGNGTFNQTGGINSLSNATLAVGTNANVAGTYLLQGGTLTASNNTAEYVGRSGNGTLTQTNGNNTISNGTLVVGSGTNAVGVYNLQAGNLTVTGSETIGSSYGNGNFNQSGGTHTVNNTLTIGNDGTGAYLLGNGTLTVNGNETVAQGGTTSTFTQIGGIHNINGNLDIGANQFDLATGYYYLNGGTLNILGGGYESIGDDGIGTFQQSGGLNNVTGSLYVGSAFLGISGETDSYQLGGGTLTVTGTEYVGFNTAGHFSQTFGTNNANAGLNIGTAYGFTSFYVLGGGTLATPSINVNGNTSNFQWTGGTLNLTAGITFDPSASASSTSAAFGTSLTLNSGMNLITTNETVGGALPFTLTVNSGATDTASVSFTVTPTGTLNQAGGSISATVNNQGLFNFSGGSFTGQFVNFGTANISLAFAPTGGIWNLGAINLSTLSSSINATGTSILNQGSISLAGGSLTGSAINNLGLISGFGNINFPGLVNSGTITQSGGTLFIASPTTGFVNSGTLNLAPGLTTFLTGAANAANDGTINLNGGSLCDNSSNPIVTLTNNADGILLGPGKIYGPFINNGSVQPGNGTLTLSQAWTNSGFVTLSGSASALAGGIITNNGSIQGAGTVTVAVTNNGSIEAVGGILTLTGAVTNSATGAIYASTGNKVLVTSGLATNSGLISLTGGTFDNNAHPLLNNGNITGYGSIRASTLTNNANMTFTGGTTTINGDLVNNASKTINFKYQPAVVTGNITNNGTIKTTSTTVTFLGNYSGNNFTSDPATNIFQGTATTIAGGLMTGSTGDVFNFAGGIFTNNGTFQNGGTLQVATGIINTGTFTQSGPQSWSTGATFINNAGTATFGSNAKLYGLTITGGTVDTTTSLLVIQPASKSAALASLRSNIANHSLTSSALPAHTALALIDNGALAKPFTTFGNQPVDSNSLLLAPELLGDSNIDGHVDLTDLSTVLNNFGSTTAAWNNGNFDGAATIDLTDLSAVLNNFGLTYANSSAAASAAVISTPTPEPASLALLVAGGAGLLLRRRSRG